MSLHPVGIQDNRSNQSLKRSEKVMKREKIAKLTFFDIFFHFWLPFPKIQDI